ncbi:2-hydroxycarboxylate transporter family protein [Bradyrhizobium sp. USDA 4451]
MVDTTYRPAEVPETAAPTRLAALKIGPLPIGIYVAAMAVCAAAVYFKKLPNDVIGGLSVLMLLGFLLGKVGQTIPVLKQIGGTAILCLFVPAALVSYGLMPDEALKAITTTFRTANFQYFFIACLVAGSILGMPYRVLVQGFILMFVPLLIGTIAAVSAGIVVGIAVWL